jgi:surfeit locus 1 family protein
MSMLVAALVLIALAAMCVRLGFWQIARLHQKQAMNAALRSALASPPLEIGTDVPPLEAVRGRRVHATGRYDESRQVLLSRRSGGEGMGVEVLTPLRLEGGSALMVDRGWLEAGDAQTARPEDCSEPGTLSVTGIAEAIVPVAAPVPWRTLESGPITVWSVHESALDSLRARLPYPIAPFVVRQLPATGLPARPARAVPRPLDESMHVGYAIQWFAFAALLLFGPPAVVAARRRALASPRGASASSR